MALSRNADRWRALSHREVLGATVTAPRSPGEPLTDYQSLTLRQPGGKARGSTLRASVSRNLSQAGESHPG
jgi:hypothetical protein